MIIKGLFRRYERWNPVHPTSGAFWGMGLGFGCGIGWGPGFGPEAIGYVGAGCGLGFSVGITLAGFGIGLPANYIYQLPYNAIVATTRHPAFPFGRSAPLLSGKDATGNVSDNAAPANATKTLSTFNKNVFLDNGVDLFDMQSKLSDRAKLFSNDFQTFCSHFLRLPKGSKD